MSSHAQTEQNFTEKAAKLLQEMPSYVKSYIRATHNRTAPRTRYEYLKDLQLFLAYVEDGIGHTPTLSDLSVLDKEYFEEYLEYMERYENKGVVRSNDRVSIKRKLSALRRFFDYLFKDGLIPSDEIRKVEMPKIHKKEIILLEPDEATELLNAIAKGENLTNKERDYHKKQAVRDMAIISLLLSTGLRVSECAELDVEDIDLAKCRVRVVRKGGDEAVVYFSDEAASALDDWLTQRAVLCKDDKEHALFLSSQKRRMSIRALEYLVRKYAIRSVPMKHITPHKLRATYATELYNQTGDIYLVADALGHKDVTTTKEHYANLSDDRRKQNRNRVTFRSDNTKQKGTDHAD